MKTKKWNGTWLAVTLIALGVSTMNSEPRVSHAQEREGTGLGNGGNSDRDQNLKTLAAKLGPKLRIPSLTTSVGAQSLGHKVSQWCSRAASMLQFEQRRARNQYGRNLKEQAKQTLIDAMVTAAQSVEVGVEPASPLTKQLLDRGLILSQAMDNVFESSDELSLSTQVNFLDEYVSFVIRTQFELDLPYYVPYVYQYGSCGWGGQPICPAEFNIAEYERRYLAFARDQLRFVYLHLTEIGRGGDGVSHIYPVGDGRAFLKAAEFISSWVAQDLAQNLFAAREACVAQQLGQLSSTLTLYNDAGDRSIFPSEPFAVFETRRELEALSGQIHSVRCVVATPYPYGSTPHPAYPVQDPWVQPY